MVRLGSVLLARSTARTIWLPRGLRFGTFTPSTNRSRPGATRGVEHQQGGIGPLVYHPGWHPAVHPSGRIGHVSRETLQSGAVRSRLARAGWPFGLGCPSGCPVNDLLGAAKLSKSDPYNHAKQARAAVRGKGFGTRCGERTRSGGTCVLTLGHSGGHAKAAAKRKRR